MKKNADIARNKTRNIKNRTYMLCKNLFWIPVKSNSKMNVIEKTTKIMLISVKIFRNLVSIS